MAEALNKLRNAGVAGPYGIAPGPLCYTELTETTVAGDCRVFDHVLRLLDGPVVWGPGADGAAVLSLRGGNFEFTVGQDLSIGYLDHTATTVRLYLQESFTFRVLAAVPLSYRAATARQRRSGAGSGCLIPGVRRGPAGSAGPSVARSGRSSNKRHHLPARGREWASRSGRIAVPAC